MKHSVFRFGACLTLMLFGILSLSASAFTPWTGTLCTPNWSGGTCYGSSVITGSVTLTSDVNISSDYIISPGSTLITNGFSVAVGNMIDYQSATITTGYNPNYNGGFGQQTPFSNSYGGSGGAGGTSGTNPSYCGQYTRYTTGCGIGGTPLGPTLSPSTDNPTILGWIFQGIQTYFTGGGGGGSSEYNNYAGGGYPTYGVYLQANTVFGSGGSINAFGQNGQNVGSCQPVCTVAGGGGSGGGVIMIAAKSIQDGTYVVNGGYPTDTYAQAGGYGQIIKYNYITQPVQTPYLIPAINTITPTSSVLEVFPTTFTINVIQKTYAIANVMISWGDGTSNIITSGSLSDSISHTYPYVSSSASFTANVQVCDTLSHCNDSFSQTISAYYNAPTENTLTANAIPSNTVLEAKSYLFTSNNIQGSYAIKNTTINWGDGTSNIITSNAVSVNAIHTYLYIAGSKPNTFNANVVVCDINSVCTSKLITIYGQYTSPSIDQITQSATAYSTFSDSYTFNIIKGNYSLSSLQVVWGDGTPTIFISINSLMPSLTHTYSTVGNYVIQATAIDINGALSPGFSYNAIVHQYISPKISSLNPTSVYSANIVTYKYTVTQGTFQLETNSVTINWGNGNTLVFNSINGANSANFLYPNNGNYSVFETVADINGYSGINTTLINVGAYPWNFTTPKPTIYYNVTNTTSQVLVQTNQTDILPVNYSLQVQNIANDFICTPSISNKGLFSISCITNPSVFKYINQTLYVAIFATDTHGSTKQVQEKIILIPKSPPPIPPATPFSTNTIQSPNPSKPFIPLNAALITIVLSAMLITSVVVAYMSRKNGKRR